MNGKTEVPVTRERLLWTSGVVIGASLPHWLHLSPWIPALLLLCVAWRIAAAQHGWRLPSRTIRLLLAALAFGGVLLQHRTINGVVAGSALLIVMVALKVLESHNQRDQLVLMIISYFLVFAGLLYEQTFLMALYLLGFAWVTTVGLLQLGRRDTLLTGACTARLAGRMLLQALPIMVVLFFLFPRLPGPLWAAPGASGSGSSGLADTMSPGDITQLGLSNAVAFRAEFFSPPPPADRLYWRGPVLASFDGRTWSRSGRARRRAGEIEYRGEATEYRVMLEPQGRRWTYALDMPRSWSGVREMTMGSDYQLRVRFAPRGARLDYRVTSFTDYRAREPLSAREQRYYTYLPEDSNPRTRELAADWVARGLAPTQIVQEALEFFRARPFVYTLTPPALGENSTDEFLFDTRAGFCGHYASAFAVMARAAGVPARVVTGYQGGELNSLGAYYIIRQSDAHAWTEVWLGEQGWTRIDPILTVAPQRIELGSPRGALSGSAAPGTAFGRLDWVRNVMLVWDAANTYWYDSVLGYGPAMQRAFLQRLGLHDPDWRELVLLAVVAMALLLAALTAHLAWRHRRLRRVDAAARYFAVFCRRLNRRRVAPRRPGETAAAYADRAEQAVPRSAPAIRRIVATYLKARYEPDPNSLALRNLRRLVKQFRPT